MSTDHSLTYRKLRLRNLAHIHRLRTILKLLERLGVGGPGKTYCDIGCSNGYITNVINGRHRFEACFGKDHEADNLKLASSRYPGIKFSNIDLNATADFEDRFDLVTCFETLEHVGDLKNALQRLLGSVNNGGTLVMSVPIEIGLIGILKFITKTYIYRYTLDELEVDRSTYWKALLSGQRLGVFRSKRKGFGTHFGFDYRDIEDALKGLCVRFESFTRGTSRFLIVSDINRDR